MSVELNGKIKEQLTIKQIYSSPDCSGSEENFYGDPSSALYRMKLKDQKDLISCPTEGM